jgi:hypothetical protein
MKDFDWAAIGTIATAISVTLIVWQVRLGRKTATADFILRLEKEFADHFGRTWEKFGPGAQWEPNGKGPSESEVVELETLLDFFATLQVLRGQRLLSLNTIDGMFAFRFFSTANNPHTRKVVESRREYWNDLIKLYGDWITFRRKKGKKIPHAEFAWKELLKQ